ncbi:MAG: PilZ domain-containing protein [Candidatus Omnitrophica bacterium]|nr:PilZ domain-containing protein [Candidatus Omnitrophota bacterium]
MKKKGFLERRKFSRFDTELKVYFKVKYDINTRVEFRVVETAPDGDNNNKYLGVCRNVSVEGLCFDSVRKLNKGDILLLEVYEPIVRSSIEMEGQVRWSKMISGGDDDKKIFRTGVLLMTVQGKPVADSIYFDKQYKVMWSAVLESLFGSFAAMKKK